MFILFQLITLPLLALSNINPSSQDMDCTVQITQVVPHKGKVFYALYDRPEAFLNTDKVRVFGAVPAGAATSLQIKLPDLPPGQYALSCFQDLDDNGYLTKNWAGIPAEPYGFSNQARPKFRAPNWSETVFSLSSAQQNLSIRLEKW